LVRPPGAREPLEQTAGLVRPNYATGVHGGITLTQLAAIRGTAGVSLAAPLAVVGAVNWPSASLRPLPADAGSPPATVYQVTSATVGDGTLSRYSVDRRYVVVATRGVLDLERQTLTLPGGVAVRCAFPVNCFAPKVCVAGHCSRGQFPSTAQARYYLPLLQPIVVAGVDPRAEQALLDVRRCVRQGNFLPSDASPTPTEDPEPAEVLPVLASDTAFVEQTLRVTVKRVGLGNPSDPTRLHGWRLVGHDSVSMQKLYRRYLKSGIADYLDPWPIWSAGDVRYQTVDADHVRANALPSHRLYERVNDYLETGLADRVLVPPESRDVWFRPVEEHLDTEAPGEGSGYRAKIWDIVGRYDPGCVIGYDQLAGGTLDAYATPAVQLPAGRSMTPSRSMAGYVSSPPLLLTTLPTARWLADPARFQGQPGNAFISVVRVRVRGTGRPAAAAQGRLAETAAAIHDVTGLDVDIVKGASTRSIRVDLPAGRFGRPAVTVREQWSVKGVAIRFTRGTDMRTLHYWESPWAAAGCCWRRPRLPVCGSAASRSPYCARSGTPRGASRRWWKWRPCCSGRRQASLPHWPRWPCRARRGPGSHQPSQPQLSALWSPQRPGWSRRWRRHAARSSPHFAENGECADHDGSVGRCRSRPPSFGPAGQPTPPPRSRASLSGRSLSDWLCSPSTRTPGDWTTPCSDGV
jgi:putative ABC transport system permease protein